jgi:nitroreductase
MEKPAPVDHPVHELIRARWSPRVFADRPVDADTLRTLLEAARWAPSCFNDQPWGFMVATRDEADAFEALLECLSPGNQSWAKGAPVLMLSVAKLTFTHNDKPNRHASHDVGLASAQMALQATALGLGLHMMGGFDKERARQVFRIPEGFEPVAAIALGYPESLEAMTEEQRERALRPRERKRLSEFVFTGRWGEKAVSVA